MAASGRPGKHLNQEERSERSRRQILDAALKLFSTRGFGATSMRDIAQKARVSTGKRLPPVPGQGDRLPRAARRVLARHRLARLPL